MSKGLWMSKDAVSLTNGEMPLDNISRMQVKRPPQWFIDGSEAERIPYKKQALEDACGRSFTGVLPSSVPTWGNSLGFNSVSTQLNERYVDPDTTRNINFDETVVPPITTEHLITGRDPFGNISPFGLAMSHSPKNSMFAVDFGGIRKVKVSEVRDSENLMPNSEFVVGGMGHDYNKMDNASVSMSLRPLTYGQEHANIFMLGESYGGEDDDFLSIRQSFNKGHGTELAIGHKNEAGSSIMPISSSYSKSNIDVMSTPQNLYKQDSSIFSVENPRKADDNMISMSQEDKGDSFILASNNYSYKIEINTMGTAQSRNKSESLGLSVSYPLDMSESSIISFGGNHNEASTSGRLICNHGLPAGQASAILDFSNLKDLAVANNPIICAAQAPSDGVESTSKRKGDRTLKNASLDTFPSNVRSLLSTGILDEVPVKYTAWSQEILHGIIKGSGYLCGCQLCNFSKVINAFEFEHHAGCKTKHPNNHIYFENGKTIYGVVQELRSTPQNMLFDVIQTVTGSPINQKSFRLWKESFLAATRELQRIYSKDERKQLL